MLRPVIVVTQGQHYSFGMYLSYYKVECRNLRIFQSLETALSAIGEASFQNDGLLFVGVDLPVPTRTMDQGRLIGIIRHNRTQQQAEKEARKKGFRAWIFLSSTPFVRQFLRTKIINKIVTRRVSIWGGAVINIINSETFTVSLYC